MHSVVSDQQALRKTHELVAEVGSALDNFDALFAPLPADPQGALDEDVANMPLTDEPHLVNDDLRYGDAPTCRGHLEKSRRRFRAENPG